MLIEDIKDERIRAILRAVKNNSTVSNACKEVGMTPQNFYKYMRKTPERQKLYDDLKDTMSDNVEMALYKRAKEGDIHAIKFWLTNCRPEKWKDAKHIDGKNDLTIKSPKDIREVIKQELNLDDGDIEKLANFNDFLNNN